MSNISYKKIAISILAALDNEENKVIGIVSSNPLVDVKIASQCIADAFEGMDIPVICADGVVSGKENIVLGEPEIMSESLSVISFKQKIGAKMTGYTAKNAVDSCRQSARITLLALDNPAVSATAMMLGGNCDGILLAEKINSSHSDKIENTLMTIDSIFVKPIGFILV